MHARRILWKAPEYWRRAPVIEIYSMVNLPNGDSTLHTREHEGEPDFYDVIVRFDGDDPLEEIEDLKTPEEAEQAARSLQVKYKGAQIEDIIT